MQSPLCDGYLSYLSHLSPAYNDVVLSGRATYLVEQSPHRELLEFVLKQALPQSVGDLASGHVKEHTPPEHCELPRLAVGQAWPHAPQDVRLVCSGWALGRWARQAAHSMHRTPCTVRWTITAGTVMKLR